MHSFLVEQKWQVYTYTDCNDVIEKVGKLEPEIILMVTGYLVWRRALHSAA
jgi:hypothetical protein